MRSIPKLALATSVAALALAGCATANAQTRSRTPAANAPISAAEAQQGAEAHPQILSEFGGTYTGPQARYIETVGKNIAVQSGLAGARDAFTVSTIDSSVNNAFAIPGGYIYTTRQLVALMNNEAELAAVLGHEVAHVAARHAQRRQQNATRNTLLGGLGAILSGVLLGNSQIGQTLSRGLLQGSQMLTLSFSRNQELEADRLGIGYLQRAGYDPRAMSTVLTSLARQNALDAQLQNRNASIPEWASTHPDPASRVQTAARLAQGMAGLTNRDTFLQNISGIVYGDDPKQGVIEGRTFIHPELRFAFTAPNGFYMVNSPRAVSINGQSGRAQLSMAQYNGNLESYVTQVFAALGGNQQRLAPQQMQRTSVNGLPAAYGIARVNQGNSQVDVVVFAYDMGNGQAYHFTAITPAGRSGVFNPMFQSMRRINQAEAGRVVPRRVEVVQVRSGDTVRSLASRMAYTDAQEARFRVLNGLGNAEEVQPGQRVKVVVRAAR